MNTPSYYSILIAEVRYCKDLSANEKLLYSEITALSNKNGYCTAKNRYFAELYNVHKNTVSSWISNLEKQGFITSKIITHEGQIVERRLSIKSFRGVNQNHDTPINENHDTPKQKPEGKENTTSFNTTSFNTTSVNTPYSPPKGDDPYDQREEFEEVFQEVEIVEPEPTKSANGRQTVSQTANTKKENRPPRNVRELGFEGETWRKITEQVIQDFNRVTGQSRRYGKAIEKRIRARIEEGATFQDFENCHRNMMFKWIDDPKMRDYIRPETLHGTKFDNYVNQKPVTREEIEKSKRAKRKATTTVKQDFSF